jgi:hypothetical protein
MKKDIITLAATHHSQRLKEYQDCYIIPTPECLGNKSPTQKKPITIMATSGQGLHRPGSLSSISLTSQVVPDEESQVDMLISFHNNYQHCIIFHHDTYYNSDSKS